MQLATLTARPLPLSQPVGASCHDLTHLRRAETLAMDFATLSPLVASRDLPQRPPMGWQRFHEWAESAALPVYALGGMAPSHAVKVRECSGQGVAGIHEFWP
jgi:8-oxo-dGTP diphosphatase